MSQMNPSSSRRVTASGASVQVALKRPYRTKQAGGMARLTYVEEEHAVFEEAKLLVWANSLLRVAYDFILNFVHPSGDPPPFIIPEFRFVAAGIAIALKPLDMSGPTPSTNRAVYLLEERLPGEKANFVKYLHNASATAEIPSDDPNYHIAEFLMFIQHVQYAITHGVAYVSDFQGMASFVSVQVLFCEFTTFC
jgi:hypothetical protein